MIQLVQSTAMDLINNEVWYDLRKVGCRHDRAHIRCAAWAARDLLCKDGSDEGGAGDGC
jgi:hypothetical protein